MQKYQVFHFTDESRFADSFLGRVQPAEARRMMTSGTC